MNSIHGKKLNQERAAAVPKGSTSDFTDTTDMPLSRKPEEITVAFQASPFDLAGNPPSPLSAPQTPLTPAGAIFEPLQQPLLGAHSIEASAGTGKTYSITLLWLRLLVEENMSVEEILVTTFTNAATAELKDRLLSSLRRAIAAAKGEAKGGQEAEIIQQAIAKQKAKEGLDAETLSEKSAAVVLVRSLEEALSNFDLAPIYTIHGFCQSMISRQVLELGADPDVKPVTDCSEIRDQIVDDELMRHAATAPISLEEARSMAKELSKELSMKEDRVLVPKVSGDTSQAAWEQAVTSLNAHLPELESRLVEIKVHTSSIPKTLLIIQSLAKGNAAGEMAAGSWTKIEANIKPLAQAIKQAQACLSAQRGQAVIDLRDAVRKGLPQRKADANIRTFDDILLTVHMALDNENSPLAKEVRKRFRAAIVDECQDSDEMQIQIFQKLFQHPDTKSFLVIGDPKQSIYRFRGADLASYRNLASQATAAPEMKKNYRSDKPLVDAINSLYAKNPEFADCQAGELQPTRYVKVEADAKDPRIFDGQQAKPVVVLWSECSGRADARWDLAEQLAAECHRLLNSNVEVVDANSRQRRRVQASDLAVLSSANKDLTLVRQALQRKGIACQMSGRGLGHVLCSDEARDVLAWLCALSAQERKANVLPNLLAFCATPLSGMEAINSTLVIK